MSGRAAIYRPYDAAGDLLYIGVANRPDERLRSHASMKRWWGEVARKVIDWYPTREAADAAETAAIAAENPRYNILRRGADGKIRMRRDAPEEAWSSGMPHWEVRYGAVAPHAQVARREAGSGPTSMKLFRVEPDLWEDFGKACAAQRATRSDVLRGHMARRVKAWEKAQGGEPPRRD